MLAMRLADDLGAEMLQEFFGVVAGRFGLDHDGLAGGGKARQQHRRFELGRRHRRFVFDRQRVGRALERQRQPAALGILDHPGAHLFERIENPPHRPAAQGSVAVESRGNAAAGDRADHQPAAGAGIAEIERPGRLGKAADADAMNPPGTVRQTLQRGAERPHRLGGVQHVLALQQAGNQGFADRQGRQDQSPVGNRFVARYADAAGQRAALAGGKRGRSGGGGHGTAVLGLLP